MAESDPPQPLLPQRRPAYHRRFLHRFAPMAASSYLALISLFPPLQHQWPPAASLIPLLLLRLLSRREKSSLAAAWWRERKDVLILVFGRNLSSQQKHRVLVGWRWSELDQIKTTKPAWSAFDDHKNVTTNHSDTAPFILLAIFVFVCINSID